MSADLFVFRNAPQGLRIIPRCLTCAPCPQETLEEQRKAALRNEEWLRKKQKEDDAKAIARVKEELRKDRAERGFASKDSEEEKKKEEEQNRIKCAPPTTWPVCGRRYE